MCGRWPRFQFDEVVEAVAADKDRLRAEHGDEAFGRRGRRDRLSGEIQLDPGGAINQHAIRGQKAAASVEARLLLGAEHFGLPKIVGTGERGMAAEVNFSAGSEPAKIVAILYFLIP